ncbi:MAG: dipeptide ABC transporter permease DppC, partial [Geminicoccaceae bacterium]
MAGRLDARPIELGASGAPPHPLVEFWHYFRGNPGAVAGLAVIVLVTLTAIFADFVAPHGPAQQFRDHLLAPPFWNPAGSTEFLLGTDAVGRDILSRIIYGARYSLLIGLIVVTLSLSAGVSLGLVAGFFRGWP